MARSIVRKNLELYTRDKFINIRIHSQRKQLPNEALESALLKIFRAQLDIHLSKRIKKSVQPQFRDNTREFPAKFLPQIVYDLVGMEKESTLAC